MIKSISSVPVQQFQAIADKRGYDADVTKDYVSDVKKEYSSASKINNVASLAMIGSALGTAAIKAKKAKLPLKDTLAIQFKPLTNAFKVADNNFEKIFKTKGVLNKVVDSAIETVKLIGRELKGFYLSVPKKVRIPAVAIIGLTTLGYHVSRNKLEAKYDAVQYMKDREVTSKVEESAVKPEAVEATEE